MPAPTPDPAAAPARETAAIDKLPLLVLLALFFASRALAWSQGVRIDLTANYQWQLLDPSLLTGNLGESLLYLHAQPPLFNALHGAVLSLCSGAAAQTFAWQVIQLGLGVVMLVSLHATMRMLRVGRVAGTVLVALLCCSPAAIAYENFLSYTHLDAALISVAACSLAAATTRGSRAGGLGTFLAMTALCLSRSAFHLVWLLAVAAVLLWWARAARRELRASVLRAALVAVVLVGGLYAKNLVLFGFAGSSSWMGMNFATMTHTNLDASVRDDLRDGGSASPLVMHDPFRPLSLYPQPAAAPSPSGVAALDQVSRFDGSPNFNHRDYIALSRQFGMDAFAVLRARPGHYAKAVLRNAATFLFRSASDYRLIDPNMDRMRRWEAIHSLIAYGQFGGIARAFSGAPPVVEGELLKHLSLGAAVWKKASEACLLLAALVVGMTGYAFWQACFRRRRAEWPWFAFAAVTLGYVIAVTLLANFGEAQRMRFEVEPLFVVLVGMFLRDVSAWRQRRVVGAGASMQGAA
ncbi:MAG: hypothetical protein MUC36_00275 [Planctomycetes bacterium]|jgi:hypothetical protein|nr:hypothetical protein [Planctomycetota bacterium]